MTHAESMSEFGQTLQVHHKRPFRLFATYEAANVLDNLLTLCPRCHRKADSEWNRVYGR